MIHTIFWFQNEVFKEFTNIFNVSSLGNFIKTWNKVKSKRDFFLLDKKPSYYSLKIIHFILLLLPTTFFIYVHSTCTYPLHVIHIAWEVPILMTKWLRKGIFRAVSKIYDGTFFLITLDLRCWQGPKDTLWYGCFIYISNMGLFEKRSTHRLQKKICFS